jgi:hypothetical protein
MKRKLVVGALAGAAAILFTVATSRADPNLTNVPKHRHYIKTATGDLVEVGPRLCDNPDLQRAFNQFHNNIHVVTGSAIGPAAPGLHNLQGAEVLARGC